MDAEPLEDASLEVEPSLDVPDSVVRARRGCPVVPGATLAEIEWWAIYTTLESVGWATGRAAKILGMSTRTIQYRVVENQASKWIAARRREVLRAARDLVAARAQTPPTEVFASPSTL